LLEKGVPFEKKLVNLQDKPADFCELYATASPDPLVARAKVPILQHGAEVLIESALICQYLEAEFSTVGTALLPPSAVDRYQIALFEEAYSSLVGGPATKIISATGDEQVETEARESLARGMKAMDSYLLRMSSDGPFVLGGKFSMAEVMTGPFIVRRLATVPAIAGFDMREHCKKEGLLRLLQWMDAVTSRPSIKDTTPSADDLVASTRSMMARMKGSK